MLALWRQNTSTSEKVRRVAWLVPTQTQPTGAVPAKGDQASLANGTELQVKERVFVFDYKMDIKHPSSLRLAHPDVCEYIDLGRVI